MSATTHTARSTDIAAARAADEQIAAAWDLYWEARKPADSLSSDLPDVRKRLRMAQRYAAQRPSDSNTESVTRYEVKIADLEAQRDAIIEAAERLRLAAIRLDAELYTGWQRFYLVQHIHSSQHCSSFRPTTRVGWLPNLSGLTEAEAVAEHGAILCTICFPSAPTEWTNGTKNERCAGAGKPINRDLPGRFGYMAGNWATCPDCGKRVGVTRTGYRIPKHQ